MKLFLFLFFLLYPNKGNSQSNNKFTTHIDTARNVNINGGKNFVNRAGNVTIKYDSLIVNQKIKTNVYFAGKTEKFDTLNKIYTTLLYFSPDDYSASYIVNMSLHLNQKILPSPHPADSKLNVPFNIYGTDYYFFNGETGVSADSTTIYLKGQIMADTFIISVNSKSQLRAIISGVNGHKN